jgi:polyphosphate:AMP phosphotransferase
MTPKRGDKQKAQRSGAAADVETQTAELRDRLLDAQFALKRERTFGLVLIVTGQAAAGRTESVNRLIEWLDPKFIAVSAFGAPNADERHRPVMWRYWQALPPRGRAIVLFGGWYNPYLLQVLESGRKPKARDRRRLERIVLHEQTLAANGIKVVKVHLHIAPRLQRRRLEKLTRDPLTAWRVTARDRWESEHYRRVDRTMEDCMAATSHAGGVWHRVDGADEAGRELAVGRILLNSMARGLADAKRDRPKGEPLMKPRATSPLPSHQKGDDIDADDYDRELAVLQRRLALLTRHKRFRKTSLVLAFEGVDAAGKGGAIRRVVRALDARQYQVVPISAPTEQELSYPYLWRFWREVPARGRIAIFDRSWYGRVLVERVRGFTAETDWRRAYAEIREFELELTERNAVVAKFWLQVGLDEQKRRFDARDENPLKRFKVDPEDWINREFYAGYQLAAREMIAKTDVPDARWTVVEADDKRHARLKVLRTICESIEARVGE